MRFGLRIAVAFVLVGTLVWAIAGAASADGRQMHSLLMSGDRTAEIWEFSYDQVWTQHRFSDRGYLNSQLDITRQTAGYAAGARIHLNRRQSFSFRPETFSVEVRDGVTVVTTDETTPSEVYRVDQPVSLALRKSFGAWDVGTSFAVLRETENRSDPRLDEVESDIFFVSFSEILAEKTSVISSLVGQYRWGSLRVQAGLMDVPVASFGSGSFKRAYQPDPIPYAALGFDAGQVAVSGFLDSKRASAAYRHDLITLSGEGSGVLRADVSYQRGLDAFAFDRVRMALTLPLARRFEGFVGFDRVWSGSNALREQDFQRWQNAGLFGDEQSLFSKLPHHAIRAGIRLRLPDRTRWPVELISANMYREHLFPVERMMYAAEPIGHISLRSIAEKWVDLYVRVSFGDQELYRSETIRAGPQDAIKIPIYLHLPPETGELEGNLRLDVSVVVDEREELVTRLSATFLGQNAWPGLTWQLRHFLTPEQDSVRTRSERLYVDSQTETSGGGGPALRFERLATFLTALGRDLSYIPDATSTRTVDHVRYPEETLRAGGGDCEDLTVLLASGLMAVGIRTAVVDLRPADASGGVSGAATNDSPWGHVFLLVDTGIDVNAMGVLGLTEFEAVTRVDSSGRATLWIPIEPTVLKAGFETALSVGARQYYDSVIANDGLENGRVHVIDF